MKSESNNKTLNGKKILLCVTGGIAAYKSAFLIREFVKSGAEVKVAITESAKQFVTPLTLSVLSGNEVITEVFPSNQKNTTWHINTAIWADIIVVAPATVNTIAKIAYGLADNAVTTLLSAKRSPVILAPAADEDMYENPINRENLKKLSNLGYYILEGESGFLASGLIGSGRLASIDKIFDATKLVLSGYNKDLSNLNILVTAGPTFEDIDPVRYIGNRSSGKMGYSIAKNAFLRGAKVTLISGPVNVEGYQEISLIKVRSASEMKKAVIQSVENGGFNWLIMAAAVADYRPKVFNDKKIKKENNLNSIELEETEDVLLSIKNHNIFKCGFALETDNETENALIKLKNKNLDMIVLNSLKEIGAGFEFDTNKVKIISEKKISDIPLISKFEAASKILDFAKELYGR